MATKRKVGRPSIFSNALADKICSRISKGESVRKICKDADMPDASTIYLWLLDEEKKDFFKQYARARDSQAELMFDELLEIADNGKIDVNRLRLRVDTRKWYLSKVLPKKFGDKIDVTSLGDKLPTPILGYVSENHSTAKNTETNEED